jgi:DNA-binding MarR family transcriptional regulator
MVRSSPPANDTQALLQLDNQLCFALYATSLAMTKLYKPLLDRLDLTYPQYLVMLVLWEHGEQTVGELGERLFLDSGTLTPLLKRLQAAGLVERQRDARDERRVKVQLTPQGQALREAAVQVPLEVACATQCDLSEIADLRQRLHGLRQRLSLHPAPSPAAPSTRRAA